MTKLTDMKRLEEAATKSPWRMGGVHESKTMVYALAEQTDDLFCSHIEGDNAYPDAEFIAASRSFVPWAIAWMEQAKLVLTMELSRIDKDRDPARYDRIKDLLKELEDGKD